MLSSRCDGVLGGVVTAYLCVGTVLGVAGGDTRGAARWYVTTDPASTLRPPSGSDLTNVPASCPGSPDSSAPLTQRSPAFSIAACTSASLLPTLISGTETDSGPLE